MKQFAQGLTVVPIYILVFLLPLFFLPFTYEGFEFNKLYLLLVLVALSFLGWLIKKVFVDRAFSVKTTPLGLAILPLFIAALVSTVFSQDLITSLLGFHGRFSSSFIELLLWLVFYFLIVNNFSYFAAKQLLIPLFISGAFLALIFHLAWLGILRLIPFLSLSVISPLGLSPQLLGVFEALVLALMVLYASLYAPKKMLPFYVVAFILMLACVMVINFFGSWIILLGSLIPFLVWVIMSHVLSGEQVNRLSMIVVIVLASLLLAAFPRITGFFNIQEYPLLSHGASWTIARGVITSGSLSSFVGTGMGNYAAAYNLFRPVAFNQALEWARMFDVGSSYYMTTIATMGIVGMLAFLSFAGLTLYLLIGLMYKKGEFRNEGGFYLFGFIALLISLGVYYQSLGLALVFWLFLAPAALLLGHARSFKEYRYAIGFTPETNLFATSFFFVVLFIIAVVLYEASEFYQAELAYATTLRNPNVNEQLVSALQAEQLNPYRIQYHFIAAQLALAKVVQDVQKIGPQNIKDVTPFQTLAQQARIEADQIIQLAPYSTISWEGRGTIYQGLRDLVSDQAGKTQAAQTAIEAYAKAKTLEPTNPGVPLQIGSLYMDEGDLVHAREYFDAAAKLKSDYANLALMQALLSEKQHKLKEAINALDSLVPRLTGLFQGGEVTSGFVQDVLFHLGRIAYNDNQFKKSVDALSQVVQINPNHSNAHYALGLAYEQLKERAKALEEYKKAFNLNPGNAQLKAKIDSLK